MLFRLVQLMCLTSVIYTTNNLIFIPVSTRLSNLLSKQRIHPRITPQPRIPNSPLETSFLIPWTSSDSALAAGLGHDRPILLSEDLFISKSFAQSMGPSRIIPFFYRATGRINSDDITVTTLITADRFKVFARLVDKYQGPISVTVHVRNSTSHIMDLLGSLHAMYTSSPKMSTYVDVHLVIDSFDRQFNTWRNIARLFARSDFVMMLDVDFAVCTDFRGAILKSPAVKERLSRGDAAFVVPAFEYTKRAEGTDSTSFPTTKKSLLSLVKSNRVSMFHASWPVGHNSTDYHRFYTSPPGAIYKVTQYQSAYEPYVIFRKSGPPWCDERFIGYGGNKAACLFEMYLSGVSFYVLSDHFLIHQNHAYEEVARKNERKYNKKVYADFKWETCLRYLRNYHTAGVLNTSRGYNVQEECSRFPGVAKAAEQMLATPQ